MKCFIAPMLSVRNGAKAVEFYKAALDAAELFRIENPAGEVVARLSIDGAEFQTVIPVDNRHGWRVGRIADPFGHHWEIGRPLE